MLIARRTTGVSANFRKFAGVGFGSARCAWYGLKIEGSATVFRCASFRCPSTAATSPAPNRFHALQIESFTPTPLHPPAFAYSSFN